MKQNRVIKFDSKETVLKKARSYVESVETFDESDRAIPLLLKAMELADRDFKREIMLLLGSFAKEAVVWPLYAIMTDSSESEDIRHDAAIHLSVIGPFLNNPQTLANRLQEEIESSDPERRLHATLAMGWRGNSQTAISLVERLYDSDDRVQQTAVNVTWMQHSLDVTQPLNVMPNGTIISANMNFSGRLNKCYLWNH